MSDYEYRVVGSDGKPAFNAQAITTEADRADQWRKLADIERKPQRPHRLERRPTGAWSPVPVDPKETTPDE